MPTKEKKPAVKNRPSAKRVPRKKVAGRNTAVKKSATKNSPKKAAPKKKAIATKKKASPKQKKVQIAKKKVSIAKKKTTQRTASLSPAINEKKQSTPPQVPGMQKTDTPGTDVQSPAAEVKRNVIPSSDRKSMQQAAVRNYDNHHLSISSHRKGGPKPAGKKPLW